ncbi:hypothetical protein E4U22_005466 [Claviceps purpurea]|nr:hypothetical protein E4U22_005466 [Claviceps purpurea]
MDIDEKEQQGVPSDLGFQAGPTHSLYMSACSIRGTGDRRQQPFTQWFMTRRVREGR